VDAHDHGDDPGRPTARARRWAAGLAWALWTLVLLGLTVTPWLNQQARQADRSDLGSDANSAIYGLVGDVVGMGAAGDRVLGQPHGGVGGRRGGLGHRRVEDGGSGPTGRRRRRSP